MKQNKWKVIKKRVAFSTPYRRVDEWKIKIPNGDVNHYFFGVEADFVIIFALTKDNKVILNDQYNLYTGKRGLELPAGNIGNKHSALYAARHELLEETGYSAKKFIKLGRAGTGRWNSNYANYFLALDVEYKQKQTLEPSEDIKVRLIPLKKYITMLRTGKIKYNAVIACSYLALDKLGKL